MEEVRAHVKHVVVIFPENVSFDHYFGRMNEYRQIKGIYDSAVDERSSTLALPDVAGNPVTQYHVQTACIENLQPSWDSEHFDYDGGKIFLHERYNFALLFSDFASRILAAAGEGISKDEKNWRHR